MVDEVAAAAESERRHGRRHVGVTLFVGLVAIYVGRWVLSDVRTYRIGQVVFLAGATLAVAAIVRYAFTRTRD